MNILSDIIVFIVLAIVYLICRFGIILFIGLVILDVGLFYLAHKMWSEDRKLGALFIGGVALFLLFILVLVAHLALIL